MSEKGYSVIGRSIPRVDAPEKVTGRARYGADLHLPGMLYGKVLRSSLPHARILRIDTSHAEQLVGVVTVITARDVPAVRYGMMVWDEAIFAGDKVRHVGDRVAAVAAESEAVAEEALELIRVEYEELPPLFDPEEALRPDAPLIHEDWESYNAAGYPGMPLMTERRGNMAGHNSIHFGDVEQGFTAADLILEETYTTPMVHQAYLEPHAVVVEVDGEGRIHVWTSTQASFGLRALLSQSLQVPPERIVLTPAYVGGGFGGRHSLVAAHVCAALALKARRSVQLVFSRAEEFCGATPRHPATIRVKSGVKRDGALVARDLRAVFNTGAYSDFGVILAGTACGMACGVYRIPNVRAEGYVVYTNAPNCGAYRAPGAPQMTFAVESHMDSLARQLNIDPLEFRLKNLMQPGDLSLMGLKLNNSPRTVLKKAAEGIGWGSPVGKNRGKGLACSEHPVIPMETSIALTIQENGSVEILSGAIDLGGTNTAVAQIVAEELGLAFEEVRMVTADTNTALEAPPSGGSWITYNVGNAALKAARDVRQKLLEFAAREMDVEPAKLELRGKEVVVRDLPGRSLPIGELSRLHRSATGELIRGQCLKEILPPSSSIFVAQGVEVEVDPETGNVVVLRVVTAQDAGKAVNPMAVEGQFVGGVSQGIGYGLSEEMILAGGAVQNPTLMDFKLPTALDMPPVETAIVEEASEHGPFGIKGVGEPPCIPTAAAIANAVCAAIGARVKELPLKPERVLAALRGNP